LRQLATHELGRRLPRISSEGIIWCEASGRGYIFKKNFQKNIALH
jgi:hypothetical protein